MLNHLRSHAGIFLTVFSFLLVSVATAIQLHQLSDIFDEGFSLVYPDQILRGEQLGRDFLSVYGPFNYDLIAVVFKTFGSSVTVERLVGGVYGFLFTASIGFVVNRTRGFVGGAWAVLFAAAAFGGGLIIAEAYLAAVAWCAVGVACVVAAGTSKRPFLAYGAAGLALGFSVGCRLDTGFVSVLIFLAFALGRRALGPMLVGAAVGLIPLLITVAQAGISAVWLEEAKEPIFITAPLRRSPFGLLPTGSKVIAVIVVLAVIAQIGAFTVERTRLNLGLLLFAAGALPQEFQSSDYGHVFHSAMIALPVGVSALGVLVRSPKLGRLKTVAIAASLVLATGTLVEMGRIGRSSDFPRGIRVTNEGRSVPFDSSRGEQAQMLLNYVDQNEPPGSRFFVGPRDLRVGSGNDVAFYYLLPDYTPGSFYLEDEPGVSNVAGNGLEAQLLSDQFLILDSSNKYILGSTRADRIVGEDFRIVGQWGPLSLLDRN